MVLVAATWPGTPGRATLSGVSTSYAGIYPSMRGLVGPPFSGKVLAYFKLWC
jgi:hypothetical protein